MGQSLDRPCLKRLKPHDSTSQYIYSQDWKKSANNHHITPLSLLASRKEKRSKKANRTEESLELEYMEPYSLDKKSYGLKLVIGPMVVYKWSDVKAIKLEIPYIEFETIQNKKHFLRSLKSLPISFPNLTKLSLVISSESFAYSETLANALKQLRFLQTLHLEYEYCDPPESIKRSIYLIKQISQMHHLQVINIQLCFLQLFYNEKERTLNLIFEFTQDGHQDFNLMGVIENFTNYMGNYLRDLNQFEFQMNWPQAQEISDYRNIEEILTVVSRSKKLEKLSFRIYGHFLNDEMVQSFFGIIRRNTNLKELTFFAGFQSQLTKKAFELIIDELTENFKSLKHLYLNIYPRSRTQNTELSEENIILGVMKICRNHVDLDTLIISIQRKETFSEEGLERIAKEVADNLRKLTRLALKINWSELYLK